MHRILIVEDLTVDAQALMLRRPIRRFLKRPVGNIADGFRFTPELTDIPDGPLSLALDSLRQAPIASFDETATIDSAAKAIGDAAVVVSKDVSVALQLAKEIPFSLIISDLFLFRNSDQLWRAYGDAYAEHVDFDSEMLPQIANPAGLQLVDAIRSSVNGATSASVPIIVMTFFWNHPRFEVYRERLETTPMPLAFLPKYYKATRESRNAPYFAPRRSVVDKADDVFDLLLDYSLKASAELKDGLIDFRRLVPFAFDYVAALLHIDNLEPRLRQGFENLRTSFDSLCHSFVTATLVFDLSKVCGPPTVGSNEFQYVAEQLLSSPTALATVVIEHEPETEYDLDARAESRLVSLPGGSTSEHAAEQRRFLFLLALALNTLPLPVGRGQSIPTEKVRQMLISAGISENSLGNRFASQTVSQLRDRLQRHLGKRDFIAASHYIVDEGHKGYYLNTGYRVVYRSERPLNARSG